MPQAIDEFRTEGYQRHNRARLEHLASLGLDLENKTVLELGAGIGDHTGFWLERGCTVTAVEARRENAARLQQAYPQVKLLTDDLEHVYDADYGPFDRYQIVYAYGILYHLNFRTILSVLWCWAELSTELLLLETCVQGWAEHGGIFEISEDRLAPTGSYSGDGCRPTRIGIFRQLRNHLPYVYMPITQPDHEEFPLEWPTEPGEGLMRSVFIGSRKALNSSLLVEGLPIRQARYKRGAA